MAARSIALRRGRSRVLIPRPPWRGQTRRRSASVRFTFGRNSNDLCEVCFMAPPPFVPSGYSCPHGCCGRFRAAPPLRHAAEFGATLTHFHISTLSHFHNSTFSHFQRPHNPPPSCVGIAAFHARACTPRVSSPIYTPSASSISPSAVGLGHLRYVMRQHPIYSILVHKSLTLLTPFHGHKDEGIISRPKLSPVSRERFKRDPPKSGTSGHDHFALMLCISSPPRTQIQARSDATSPVGAGSSTLNRPSGETGRHTTTADLVAQRS